MNKCNTFIKVSDREEFAKTLGYMVEELMSKCADKDVTHYSFYFSEQAYETYISDFSSIPFYKAIRIFKDLRLNDKIPYHSDMDVATQVKHMLSQVQLVYCPEKPEKLSQYKVFADLDITRPRITKVIFNDPATIVYWNDGDKTVVKVDTDSWETFDPEKGLAMAIVKKLMGYIRNSTDL